MYKEQAWKRLKNWHNLLRKLEEDKRRRIIDSLEIQISTKQIELEERNIKFADEAKKQRQAIEKRETQLREKRKELEIEKQIQLLSNE